MFLVRGIVFSHEAVRDWEAKLTPALVEGMRRRRRGKVGKSWYVDETYIKVHGHWRYLDRAIDRNGGLVDVMFSEHRDMAAAKTFFQSAKTVSDMTPDRMTSDGHDSYPRAIRGRSREAWHQPLSQQSIGGGSPCHHRLPYTSRCVGSSALDRLTDSVEVTMSCETSSVPAPALINRFPPTTAGSVLSAALRP
jgi:transposase-like protein